MSRKRRTRFTCKRCGARTYRKKLMLNHKCKLMKFRFQIPPRLNEHLIENRYRTFHERMLEEKFDFYDDDKSEQYYLNKLEEMKSLYHGDPEKNGPLSVGYMFPPGIRNQKLLTENPTPNNQFSTSMKESKNQNVEEQRRRFASQTGRGSMKSYLMSPTTKKRRDRLRKTLPLTKIELRKKDTNEVSVFNLTFPRRKSTRKKRGRRKKKKKKKIISKSPKRGKFRKKESAHDVLLLSQWKKTGRTIRTIEPENPESLNLKYKRINSEVYSNGKVLPYEEYTDALSSYYSETGGSESYDDPYDSFQKQIPQQQQQQPIRHMNTYQGPSTSQQNNTHMNTIQGNGSFSLQQQQQHRPSHMNTYQGPSRSHQSHTHMNTIQGNGSFSFQQQQSNQRHTIQGRLTNFQNNNNPQQQQQHSQKNSNEYRSFPVLGNNLQQQQQQQQQQHTVPNQQPLPQINNLNNSGRNFHTDNNQQQQQRRQQPNVFHSYQPPRQQHQMFPQPQPQPQHTYTHTSYNSHQPQQHVHHSYNPHQYPQQQQIQPVNNNYYPPHHHTHQGPSSSNRGFFPHQHQHQYQQNFQGMGRVISKEQFIDQELTKNFDL